MRALLLLPLGACVINTSPNVDATWQINRLDQLDIACPADWATTAIVVMDPTTRAVRSIDQFDCDAGSGSSTELEPGAQLVRLDVLDRDGRVIVSDREQVIEPDHLDVSLAAGLYVDAGFATAAWSWAGERSCGDTFNPFEVIRLTITGPKGVTQLFSCHDDWGVTTALPPGTYSAWLGQGIASNKSLPDFIITAPNGMTQLPVVTL